MDQGASLTFTPLCNPKSKHQGHSIVSALVSNQYFLSAKRFTYLGSISAPLRTLCGSQYRFHFTQARKLRHRSGRFPEPMLPPPRRPDSLFLQVTHIGPSDMHVINVPCSFVNQLERHQMLEGDVQMTLRLEHAFPLLSGLVELLGSWRLGECLRLLHILPTFTIGHNSPWGRDEWVPYSNGCYRVQLTTQLPTPGRESLLFLRAPAGRSGPHSHCSDDETLRLRDRANGSGKQVLK